MIVEDIGELSSYETLPEEGILYLTAIHYTSGGWTQGPSGMNKETVIEQLRTWIGVDQIRIYTVKVPLKTPSKETT